jgi:gluconate 2-dehydrogenase gamma chain
MAHSLTRRDAFVAAGLAAWTLPLVARAQAADAVKAWTPKALTILQAATLTAASETIVPTTGTPGAIAAGVPQFVDRALVDWMEPKEAERMRAGLADLDARAKAMGAASFADLPPAQRAQVAATVEAEAQAAGLAKQPHYWLALRDLATVGYFTSEIGATQALRYDPVPGAYHGCVPVKTVGRAWATA